MKTNQAGIDLIKQFEKCRLVAYDSDGEWTIGWGHTGSEVIPGLRWTQAQADAVFASDLHFFERAVERWLTGPTDDNQFSAMIALCFNIGPGWQGAKKLPGERDGFRQSSVLRFHNEGKSAEAAQAFGMWNKARDKNGVLRPLDGLTRRRAKEAALYLLPMPGDEAIDPQRTRASVVETSAPVDHILDRAQKVGGSAIGLGAVLNSLLTQLSDVWNWLQSNTGGYGAHVLTALTVLLILGGAGFMLYGWARRKN